MAVEIGGDKAWKVVAYGDISVSYQWVNNEQAMILYPTHRRLKGTGAFVICISVMHLYAKADGYPDLTVCIPRAMKAAEQMGFAVDQPRVHRIVDVILAALPDLSIMPPEPDWKERELHKAAGIGEMNIKMDGKIITERLITDLDANEMQSGAVH